MKKYIDFYCGKKFVLPLISLLCLNLATQAQSLGRVGGADITTTTKAGTVLMGGGSDVDAAFKWMIQQSGGGDFVVIRSTGTNAYNSYIYGLGGANSVETFLVASVAQANDSTLVQAVRKAEAVFFAGGNQADYVNFYKGQALGKAIVWLANVKKIPIGGTSAGDAIQGKVYYSAVTTSVISSDVLSNPYADNNDVMYDDFLQNPFLDNTICEPHFLTRGRQGRITSFMARMIQDKGRSNVKGIACDEGTAVCIDNKGIGMVVGSSQALFIRQYCAAPETCSSGTPLTWTNGVKVYVVPGDAVPGTSRYLDLKDWLTGAGGAYEYWTVNNGTITTGQTTGTPASCLITGVEEAKPTKNMQIGNLSFPDNMLLACTLNMEIPSVVSIQIIDIQGRIVYAENKPFEAGRTSLAIPLTGVSGGLYVLRLSSGTENLVQKFTLIKGY
jgi:cyanophycinase